MTMQEVSHPRDDTDRQYVLRKEGKRGFASIEDSADTSIRGFKDHIKMDKERLIRTANNSNDNIRTNRTTITMKSKWRKKKPQMYEFFKRQNGEISHEKT